MSSHRTASDIRTRRVVRSGLIALAAVGLPTAAVLVPSAASAAPEDAETLIPLDALPGPIAPTPAPPIPVPYPILPASEPVPQPAPEIEILDVTPLVPDDVLIAPTDPVDPGDDDEPDTCNEYAAANFSVSVDRYDADLIEVRLMNSDADVCDYTVWSALFAPGGETALSEATVGMESIAFATDSAGSFQQTFDDEDLCELEIRIAVEESLPMTFGHTDGDCDGPTDAPVPDDDDTPDADGATSGVEDGADDPAAPHDGEVPDDGGTTDGGEPTDRGAPDDEGPLVAADDEPRTPSLRGGGLPSSGTDTTTLMLGLGLLTLGAGSIIALATREKGELPTI